MNAIRTALGAVANRHAAPDSRRGPVPSRPLARGALPTIIAVGLLAMLLYRCSTSVVDVDLWHELALAREVLQRGAVPWEDTLAFTPTVYPCVHHEWGAGMVAWAAVRLAGNQGVAALRYALLLGLAAICYTLARRRGASPAMLGMLVPLAILMADHGFSPVRAQMYSFLGVALLLVGFERDRQGHRRWLLATLPLFLLWLNLHAGFLVGAGLLLVHGLEQWLRRESHRHLFLAGLALVPCVALNPYGWHYYAYLVRGVGLDRPLVREWAPLWEAGSVPQQGAFVLSLVLLAWALLGPIHRVVRPRWAAGIAGGFPAAVARGWFSGWSLVLVTAVYAALHTRMLPFYATLWVCYVPAALAATSLGKAVESLSDRRRGLLSVLWVVIAVVMLARTVARQPWSLEVPGTPDASRFGGTVYPVGPVAYLKDHLFQGNLLVPFDQGAYVAWKLHPRVRVSIDSRYEVAYPAEAADENHAFYQAVGTWSATLQKHSPDAVLVPRASPLDRLLEEGTAEAGTWHPVYRDSGFTLFVRPGAAADLPRCDREGQWIQGTLP